MPLVHGEPMHGDANGEEGQRERSQKVSEQRGNPRPEYAGSYATEKLGSCASLCVPASSMKIRYTHHTRVADKTYGIVGTVKESRKRTETPLM